jgi:hypothetical protein
VRERPGGGGGGRRKGGGFHFLHDNTFQLITEFEETIIRSPDREANISWWRSRGENIFHKLFYIYAIYDASKTLEVSVLVVIPRALAAAERSNRNCITAAKTFVFFLYHHRSTIKRSSTL